MKTMNKVIRFSILAVLIGMTAACGNSGADSSKSKEQAHGHSHD
jgi:ABC-type oligopeptide transport system substrate-binding subunit